MDRLFQLGLPAQFISEDEVNEMIYDILSLVAAPRVYMDKVALVDISNSYGELPCDFYNLYDGGVRHVGTGITLVYSSDVYHRSVSNLIGAAVDTQTFEGQVTTGYVSYSGYSGYSGAPNTYATGTGMDGDATYKLENGYIFTGFSDGQVEIAYQAFPTDDKGLPMVPDNERIIRCVVYNLADRIGFRMMMADQLSLQKYEFINREAVWYMGSAQNAARIPNQDQMETMARVWQDPFRDGGHHLGGFKRMSLRPRMITHNNSTRRR